MSDPELSTIMMTVAGEILGDRALCFPWYRPEIRSDDQAEAAGADLPLMFSWGEIVRDGQLRSFTVSVNGHRLAALLQRYLPRSHPDFLETRDELIRLLGEGQNATMLKLCRDFQAPPSRISAMALGQAGAS